MSGPGSILRDLFAGSSNARSHGHLLPEPDVADLGFFLGQFQMILPVQGFNFLQPKPAHDRAGPSADQSPSFVLKHVGMSATGVEGSGEFVVLKGSTARRQGGESSTSYRAMRDKVVAEGKLVWRYPYPQSRVGTPPSEEEFALERRLQFRHYY